MTEDSTETEETIDLRTVVDLKYTKWNNIRKMAMMANSKKEKIIENSEDVKENL